MATTPVGTDAGHPSAESGRAADRILRLFARFISAGYLFFLVVSIPALRVEAAYMERWWPAFAIGAVYLPAIMLGAATFRPRIIWVRRAAALTAVSYLLAACTWPLAWTGELMPLTNTSIGAIPGLAGLAAAVAWRPAWAVTYLFVADTTSNLINQFARSPTFNSPFLPDSTASFGFCLLFVAAALMAMRTGRVLDATWAEAHSTATAAATSQARIRERRHFGDLLHDWVISTLLAASRQPHNESLRRQAHLTLTKLDSLGVEGTTTPTLDMTGLLAHLRAAAAEVDDTMPIAISIEPGAEETRFPCDAAVAVATGLAEAARNSARHAGAVATCTTQVDVTRHGFRVVVADTGTGFDRGDIGVDRHGLAGIETRMNQLPGGSVRVDSGPTRGTAVHLAWTAPARLPTPEAADVRTLLGMNTRAAWLIASLFLVGIVSLAATSLSGITHVWPIPVAVLLLIAAAVGMLTVAGDPLPWVPALLITAAGPVGFTLVLTVLPVPITSSAQLWPPYIGTTICAFMCVRGRTAYAWWGVTMMIGLCVAWSIYTGQGLGYGISVSIGYLGPLAMATFFAYTIRPNARLIFELREASTRRIAADAAASAALDERLAQLQLLDIRTRPLLERIAAADALSAEEVQACGLLEAHLRSMLRGRGLVHPLVDAAASGARKRGVDVVLLDDDGMDDADQDTRERFLRSVATEIDHAETGTIAVRILPPHREHLGTIVAHTETAVRRATFDRAGRPTFSLEKRIAGGNTEPVHQADSTVGA